MIGMNKLAFLTLLFVAPSADAGQSATIVTTPDVPAQTSTVGFPVEYHEIVLPGPEVVSRPITDRAQALLVRIDQVYKHGSDFRYNMQVIGLEAGEYDVANFLETKDGSAHPGLPHIALKVESVLPPGQIEPHATVVNPTGRGGYYVPLLVAGGLFWLAGLLAIIFAGHFILGRPGTARQSLTLADKIRPMLVRAGEGNLDSKAAAELERSLTSFWRRRLRLEHLSPEVLISTLRKHDEAGPLLNQLEAWLHRPDASDTPDLEQLLRPYRSFSERGL